MGLLIKNPRDVDEDTEIVKFNVIGLYTRFPHKFEKDLHPRSKKKLVLESVNFILKKNALIFYSEYYLQVKGTAMGTIFAPI